MIGQTLSHYRIIEKIGAGGMGEVYVAEDTKLSRKVALKVLPPEMAENAERRARFEREAKAVAVLDHPNIVTIHSVEEAEGVHFITMQLVKGKTLAELIPKKGMPLNKFFDIAIPLADAVSAAHEQGIIHRDLKPDNLMVSDDGRLKILDFGLAKLKPAFAEEGASELPTQSATAEGRILGTVAYMSPEQAEGKQVDNRSDIFSIGIILYEMATGERPFKGDTGASLLSAILKDTPTSVTKLNPNLPSILARIIKRCLVKDTEHRCQTAKDVRNELEELKQGVESGETLDRVSVPSRNRWFLPATIAAVVVISVIGTYLLIKGGRKGTDDTRPADVKFTQLTSQAGTEFFPSLSPDGQFVVYSSAATGNWDIYFQRVGGKNAINLTKDCEDNDSHPSFSPDGTEIAFRSGRDGGGVFVMGATGESVKRLTEFGYHPSWSPEGGEILFDTDANPGWTGSHVSELWAVELSSGEKSKIHEGDARRPQLSPNGRRIVFFEGYEDGQRDIWTIPSNGGESVPITDDAYVDWNPFWSPNGEFVYFVSNRGGHWNIWRVRVDEETGHVLGEPRPVTAGVTAKTWDPSMSRDGNNIAYSAYVQENNLMKANFDPVTETLDGEPVYITEGSKWALHPDISPDGEWLVVRSGEVGDVAMMGSDGTGFRQLTGDDAYREFVPRWAHDGESIAFQSNRGGTGEIWIINPDGSGLRQLTESKEAACGPAWSPNGKWLSYGFGCGNLGTHIIEVDRPFHEQSPQALPPMNDQGEVFMATEWSPDGGKLAGNGVDSSGENTGLAVFSVVSQEYRKLLDYGRSPRWLSDSRRLLFSHSGSIFLMDSESGEHHEILSDVTNYVFSLSSDDRTVYFTRGRRDADIWMLTLNEERE